MQEMQKTLGDIEKEHAFPKVLDENLAPSITLFHATS